jgi:predicted CopG family antitoxin
MGSKTISITDEAYDRLKSLQQSDESFTETILRVTDHERDFRAGFGVMSDIDGFTDAAEEAHERLDTDLRERESELSRQ